MQRKDRSDSDTSLNLSTIHIKKIISQTINSTVSLATWRDKEFVLKEVPDKFTNEAEQEYAILDKLDSPYVVKIFADMQYVDNKSYLMLEYIPGLTLQQYLRQPKHATPEQKYQIVNDVIYGVEYLHSKHIIHKDLKSKNVLINLEGHAKIIDLGYAVEVPTNLYRPKVVSGTPLYMAPELFSTSQTKIYAHQPLVTNALDIWALGFILLEIHLEKHPFSKSPSLKALKESIKTFDEATLIPISCPYYLTELILLCLKKHPGDRASAKEIKNKLEQGNTITGASESIKYTPILFKSPIHTLKRSDRDAPTPTPNG